MIEEINVNKKTIESLEKRQRKYLEDIEKIVPKEYPLHVAVHNTEDKRISKWLLYKEANKNKLYDYRTIKPNELIYDIDIKEWSKCVELAEKIKEYLINQDINFSIYLSGGKGIHINVFFLVELKTPNLFSLYKKALELGFSYRDIRMFLHKRILREAGINFDKKIFDILKVSFDDNKKGSLIRACGGRKINEEGKISYKTWLAPDEEIPKRKDNLRDPDKVKFPDKFDLWTMPEEVVNECLQEFFDKHSNIEQSKVEYNINFNYSDHYLGLDCVQNIINKGCKEGERNRGSRIITIAGIKDGLTDERIKDILRVYHNNCENNHNFTEEEAFSWVQWLRSQQIVYFQHKTASELGRCGVNCKYYQQKYKKVYELLKRPDLLETIIKVVKREVAGTSQRVIFEDNNLKVIFLVCLSAVTNSPLNLKIVGQTSEGKTIMVTTIIKYFPKKMVIAAQSLSPKSLYYDHDEELEDGTKLVHLAEKIVVLLEETTSTGFINEIKALLSHDLEEVEVKTVNDGELIKTRLIGWPAYIGLSVDNTRNDELESREITISPIASKEKFKAAILENSKGNCFNEDIMHAYDEEVRNIAYALDKDLKVFNPYAEQLANLFPAVNGSDMRHYKKLENLIKIHAFLYQKQREIIEYNGKKAVIVKLNDITAVTKFFSDGLRSTLTGFNFNLKQLWEEVIISRLGIEPHTKEWALKEIITQYKAATGKDISGSSIRNMLFALENKGFTTAKKEGNKYLYSFDFNKNINEGIEDFKQKIMSIQPLTQEQIMEKIGIKKDD